MIVSRNAIIIIGMFFYQYLSCLLLIEPLHQCHFFFISLILGGRNHPLIVSVLASLNLDKKKALQHYQSKTVKRS